MIKKIREIIDPLVGLRCEHAVRFFGTMLLIDFGKKKYYLSKIDGKKMPTWDWGLDVGDVWWELRQNNNLIVGNGDTEDQISQDIKTLEGKKIQKIAISNDFQHSTFSFSDNITLEIKRKPHNEYEDWTLKTPKGMYLTIGKNKWLYQTGDSTKTF